MKIKHLLLLLLILATSACALPSVTVHGQYGDYKFTPRQPIVIESAK